MNSLFVIHTCETVCFFVLCKGNARFKIFKLLLGWTFYLNRFNRRNYFCVKSMSMFTILIKLTLRKRKFFDMIYCFCIFACDVLQLPFVGSALFLNRLVKDFRASFFFFFFLIGALEVCEQYRRCFTGQSGKSQRIDSTIFCAWTWHIMWIVEKQQARI